MELKDCLLPTYKKQDLSIIRGDGCYLYDEQGRKYLDFVAGIAVNSLGHRDRQLTEVLTKQINTLLHCSNYYRIPQQGELASKLCRLSGLAGAFFCNSGAEANEAAFKFARLYQASNDRPYAFKVISLLKSFHGRTLATLAATGSDKLHRKFQPLPQGFANLPADIKVFEQMLDQNCAAVIIEPVQGESGIHPLNATFVKQLSELCHNRKILLIFDEIQSGVGRTGSFFAAEQFGVQPDIITMAKGLGGGVPVGAILANQKVAEVITAGDHGSTFGGNPLAMAAANLVVDRVSSPQFLKLVRQRAELLAELFDANIAPSGWRRRGIGLIIGIYHHSADSAEIQQIVRHCRENGLLVNIAGDNTIRLLPPLIIEEQHCRTAIEILQRAISATNAI